uniref:ceramidase n=1 Tax=Acrobeloides nanus TaxID=290746 RepID=A0A914CA70_9BILA
MRLVIILASFFIVLQAKDVHPPIGDFTPKCLAGNGSLYDPAKSSEVPWLTVDLDLPYEQRYANVVKPFADDMKKVIAIVKEMAQIFLGNNSISAIDALMQHAFDELFPPSYREEIRQS